MKKNILLALVLCLFPFVGRAQAQQGAQKVPTPEEMAAKEADRLGDLLKLQPWQIFYVDSTLQHDYAALKAELEGLQKARVSNSSLYSAVQDKWMDQIDSSYRKFFTDSQWAAYLKSGAGKAAKAREKRKAKREASGKK